MLQLSDHENAAKGHIGRSAEQQLLCHCSTKRQADDVASVPTDVMQQREDIVDEDGLGGP